MVLPEYVLESNRYLLNDFFVFVVVRKEDHT